MVGAFGVVDGKIFTKTTTMHIYRRKEKTKHKILFVCFFPLAAVAACIDRKCTTLLAELYVSFEYQRCGGTLHASKWIPSDNCFMRVLLYFTQK
jgi:hypothetical protein